MDSEAWIQLAVLVVTLIGAAAVVYGKLCSVTTKQENVAEKLDGIVGDIRRLFELWSSRPCERHANELANLAERLKALEERVDRLYHES